MLIIQMKFWKMVHHGKYVLLVILKHLLQTNFVALFLFYILFCHIIPIKLYFIVKVIPTYEE